MEKMKQNERMKKGGGKMKKYFVVLTGIILFSLCMSLVCLPAYATDLVFSDIVYATSSYAVPSGYALKITSGSLVAVSGGTWGTVAGFIKVAGTQVYGAYCYSPSGTINQAYEFGHFPVWVQGGTSVTASNAVFTGVLYQVQ
jgi:uncharacterized membrane protein (DUF485 family)